MLWSLAFVLAAYLIGSISFAVVVSKAMGLPDPCLLYTSDAADE